MRSYCRLGRHLFTTEAAAVKQLPSSAAASTESASSSAVQAAGSTWRERFGYFLAGIAVASTCGYYRLREDVWASSQRIDTVIREFEERLQALESSIKTPS
uniref:Uncharacterized protein n=1 Tax=Spongospora subterranea TaxID=70186 RepID=A0A0H5QGP7_9EUKA|eukprot:CRZ01140.1 hypothetical protein [Spongospora subterranea]